MFEALPLEELMQGLPFAEPERASDTDGFEQLASGTNDGSGKKTSPFLQQKSPLAAADFQASPVLCFELDHNEGLCKRMQRAKATSCLQDNLDLPDANLDLPVDGTLELQDNAEATGVLFLTVSRSQSKLDR